MLKRLLVLSVLFCVLLVGAYGVPEGYVIPSDSDFVWVKDSNGYLKEGELGYWLYIGSDEYVQIPEVIQGYSMVKTNHYRMFYGNAMVKRCVFKT